MRVFVLNDADEVAGAASTGALLSRARERGPVRVVGIADLGLEPDGRVMADGVCLSEGDQVVVRTNPSRDHRKALQRLSLDLLCIARDQGVSVVNDPGGLARAETKLHLCSLPPHLRPRTLVSASRARLRAFVMEAPGPTVVKPIAGTRGRDVFKVHPDTENLPQILDVLCREGLAMAQDFVPEAVEGDVRVLVVGGRVLERGGHVCAVRRRPPAHDFRSNVAIGGVPEIGVLSPQLRAIADEAAALLYDQGLHIAGLDAIGDKLVEVNVFSPGGFPDIEKFTGQDFVGAVLDHLDSV